VPPQTDGHRTCAPLTERRDETSSQKLWTDGACEELHHQTALGSGELWHAIPWFTPTPNQKKV